MESARADRCFGHGRFGGGLVAGLVLSSCAPAPDPAPPADRPEGPELVVDDAPDWRVFHSAELVREYERLRAQAEGGRDDAALRVQLARVLMRLGRTDEARGHLRAALDREPGRVEAYYLLGTLALGETRPGEATRELERATELGPRDVPSWLARGEALLALGDEEGARACLERVHALAPENAEGAFQLALLVLGEDPGRATALLERAVRSDPWHLGATMQLSRAYRRAGRLEAAAELQERHRRVSLLEDLGVLDTPVEAVRYLKEVRHYAVHERWDEALSVCDEGLGRHPEEPGLFWLRAVALERLGRVEEAARAYSRAIDLAPGDAGSAKALARLVLEETGGEWPERTVEQMRGASERWPDEERFVAALRALACR